MPASFRYNSVWCWTLVTLLHHTASSPPAHTVHKATPLADVTALVLSYFIRLSARNRPSCLVAREVCKSTALIWSSTVHVGKPRAISVHALFWWFVKGSASRWRFNWGPYSWSCSICSLQVLFDLVSDCIPNPLHQNDYFSFNQFLHVKKM